MNPRDAARLQTQDGQNIPLLGVTLTGELRGLMFEARVEQRFCNAYDQHVEVVYSFPLPWGAALLGVEVLLGDKHLTGTVVEKKQAEARYEEALSEGNAAIMLEKNPDHSYSLNLGNLAPQEHCTVTLRYAQTLSFEQRGLRLLIPTVIAPRYGDPQQDGGLLPHQVPHHSLTVEHPFDLTLRLHGALAQARVASPSHLVGVAFSQTAAGPVLTLSLSRRSCLDRDFVLVVDQLAHDGIAIAARDSVVPEGVAVLASFCPRIPTPERASTAVKILVDCSGSMAGDSIAAAKRALQAIVQQLNEGDRFALSRFGNTVEHRSRGLWMARETTKLAAQRWVGALDANLGGTEMESALASTFALAHTVQSDVLLVTDGEISAIDRTIAAAKASGHRVFVVGIGSSPAETHLRRLAEATAGACDFVAPGEAVEPAVLRMFARLRSPRLAALRLQWPEGVQPAWASPLLPSVFDGDTVNVLALLRQPATGAVRLLGQRTPGAALEEIGRVELPTALDTAAHTADTLPRMVAGARLEGVERLRNGDPITATVTINPAQLAVDYQLVSRHTNFLLVHERAEGERATDMPELHTVAQMVPAGWGGTGSIRFSRKDLGADSMAAAPVSASGPAVPSVPSVPSVWRSNTRLRSRPDADLDEFEIPAFLRKVLDAQDIDRKDPCHWSDSREYTGLTPLGVSEWLRITPAFYWPTSYAGLRDMGLGAWVVDWLELEMAAYAGVSYPETTVVHVFLSLMSRRETHAALTQSEGLLGALKSTVQRVRGAFGGEPVQPSAKLDGALVQAMEAALQGMTARVWPQRVFALEDDVGKVCDAREPEARF